MAPPKKRTKIMHVEEKTPSPILVSDYRTAWLIKGLHQDVDIVTKDATLLASRQILSKHSSYFEACFKPPFTEAEGVVNLPDIETKYMSFYIGLAYSFSTMVRHSPPAPAEHPESSAPKQSLRDLVEVHKLCDRFASDDMGRYIHACIKTAIGDGHRALYRSAQDQALQELLMRDFADGYEALELALPAQAAVGALLVDYFCEGVDFTAWDRGMEHLGGMPRFVAAVSRMFARKLAELMSLKRKPKRREMAGP